MIVYRTFWFYIIINFNVPLRLIILKGAPINHLLSGRAPLVAEKNLFNCSTQFKLLDYLNDHIPNKPFVAVH